MFCSKWTSHIASHDTTLIREIHLRKTYQQYLYQSYNSEQFQRQENELLPLTANH